MNEAILAQNFEHSCETKPQLLLTRGHAREEFSPSVNHTDTSRKDEHELWRKVFSKNVCRSTQSFVFFVVEQMSPILSNKTAKDAWDIWANTCDRSVFQRRPTVSCFPSTHFQLHFTSSHKGNKKPPSSQQICARRCHSHWENQTHSLWHQQANLWEETPLILCHPITKSWKLYLSSFHCKK